MILHNMKKSIISITSGDILVKGFDQVRFAGDGHKSVGHVLALEEGLQDLDGADGVHVDVGDDKDPFVGTKQVEKFFSQIGDIHFF